MWGHVFYDLHFSVYLGAVVCSYLVFFRYKIVLQSVQSLSRVQLFVIPWTAARQTSLSITNSQSLPKLICIESVMPSNHLVLCRPLLLLPSIFPSIRVFTNESVLCIRLCISTINLSFFTISCDHPKGGTHCTPVAT